MKFFSLMLLLFFLLPIDTVYSYYQIIPYFEESYGINTLDYGNWYDDSQRYKNFATNINWETTKDKFSFVGDLTFKIFLEGNNKIYNNKPIFNERFEYDLDPSISKRDNVFNLRLILNNYYYGYTGDQLSFKIGAFKTELSKISVDNVVTGSYLKYKIPEKEIFLSIIGGGINREISDEDGLIIDFSSQKGGFQPSLPDGFLAWNISLREKTFKFDIYQGIIRGLTNYGVSLTAQKKRMNLNFYFSTSQDQQSNSQGYAYLIKGMYTAFKGDIFLGYAQASGYDFSLKEGEKQQYYKPIAAGKIGGYLFHSQLRNFSSIKFLSYGVSKDLETINVRITGYNYWDNTSYRFNGQTGSYLGNEVDFFMRIDLGYYFVDLDYGFFLPDSGMEKLLKNSIYDYYTSQYDTNKAALLSNEYNGEPAHKANLKIGLRF